MPDDSESTNKISGALTPSRSTEDEEDDDVNINKVDEIRQNLESQGYDPEDVFVNQVATKFQEEDDEEDDEDEDDGPDMNEIVQEEFYEEYTNFTWDAKVSEFRQNIDRSDEDPEAREKIQLLPKRLKEYFKYVSNTRENLLDLILPLTVFIYGAIFFIISYVISGPTRDLLVEVNRFGDLFLVNTVIVSIAIIIFLVSRKQSAFQEITKWDIWRKRLRRVFITLIAVPTVILGWFIFTILTQGSESVLTASSSFEELRIYLNQQVLPDQISAIGFWIWEVTPIGVSVQEVAAISALVGFVLMIPLQITLTKIVIISGTVGPREIETEDEEEEEEDKREKAIQFTESGQLQYTETEDGIPEIVERVMEKIEYETLPELSREVQEGDLRSEWDKHIDTYLEVHDDFKQNPYEKDYEEIERYWLREPYSYATILYNEEDSNYRYYAVEPQLQPNESELYRAVKSRLDTQIQSDRFDEEFDVDMDDDSKLRILEETVFDIITEYNLELSNKGLQKVFYYIERDYVGYKQIDVLMNDINAEDISCLGPDQPIWINHSTHENIITNIQFERRDLLDFNRQLAQRSGETISAANPMLDATLPDGSRAQISLGDDITTQGSTFTIRQFQEIPFTPVDLVRTKTFSLDQMAYLWLAIQNGMSLIFAGGTASGKTTSMNAMSLFIPPDTKVVTLEDTREITLPHSNWIPAKTRDGSGAEDEDAGDAVTMYNLLESALRQRPEYIVVGEVRGPEAQTLFQAMSTGHTTYSTMHADTVREAIYRLKNDPINVPEKMVNVLDIVCIQRRLVMGHKAVRRNINITELYEGGSETSHLTRKVFKRDGERDDWEDRTRNSEVLEDIRIENTWSDGYLRDEIERRKQVLQYIIDKDVKEFQNVVQILQRYMLIDEDDKDKFMKQIKNDELDPEEIDDITKLDLDVVKTPQPEDKTDQLVEDTL